MGVDLGADELSFRTFHPPKELTSGNQEGELVPDHRLWIVQSSSPWVSPSLTFQTDFPFILSSLQLAFTLGL